MSIPKMLAAATLAALLAGCNSYHLRYRAEPQPAGAHLYADFTRLQDAVAISVDTDGRRLQDIFLRTRDGATVRPARIDYPFFGHSAAIGPGIGVGGPVGVGIGVGFPIGPKRAKGLTTATFLDSAAGPPPWELHVQVDGKPEAVIPNVGGPATAQ